MTGVVAQSGSVLGIAGTEGQYRKNINTEAERKTTDTGLPHGALR